MSTDAAPLTLTEAAEATLIALAERNGVDRQITQRALKISERTYYRRRNLPASVKAARESSPEAVCSGGCL